MSYSGIDCALAQPAPEDGDEQFVAVARDLAVAKHVQRSAFRGQGLPLCSRQHDGLRRRAEVAPDVAEVIAGLIEHVVFDGVEVGRRPRLPQQLSAPAEALRRDRYPGVEGVVGGRLALGNGKGSRDAAIPMK